MTSNGLNTPSVNYVEIYFYTGLALTKIIHQIETGKWKLDTVNKQWIIYADDGTTPLYTFDLKDDTGNASVQNIFERVPT